MWWVVVVVVRPLFVVDFMLRITLKPQHVTVMCSPSCFLANITTTLIKFYQLNPFLSLSTLREVVVVTKH